MYDKGMYIVIIILYLFRTVICKRDGAETNTQAQKKKKKQCTINALYTQHA
jgi:hypothetical protein